MGTSDRDASYYMNFLEEYEDPYNNLSFYGLDHLSYDSDTISRLVYEQVYGRPCPPPLSPAELALREAQFIPKRGKKKKKKKSSRQGSSVPPRGGTTSSTNHNRPEISLVPSITPADRDTDVTVPPLSMINDPLITDQPSCLELSVPGELALQGPEIPLDATPTTPKPRRGRLKKKRWLRQLQKNPNKKPRLGNRRKRRSLIHTASLLSNVVDEIIASDNAPPVFHRKKKKKYKPRFRPNRQFQDFEPDCWAEINDTCISDPPDSISIPENIYTCSFADGTKLDADMSTVDWTIADEFHLMTKWDIDNASHYVRAVAAISCDYEPNDIKIIKNPVQAPPPSPPPLRQTTISSYMKASSSTPTLTTRGSGSKGSLDRGLKNN